MTSDYRLVVAGEIRSFRVEILEVIEKRGNINLKKL